ncbi:MAG: FAD-dependent oxidoreductase, partial [Solirubrobacterales bacterium]
MAVERGEPDDPVGERGRLRVLIAGGGIAGLEALLCLRELAGPLTEVELVSPDPDFHYRPLAVAGPFGLSEGSSLRLDQFASEHGAAYRRDSLAEVDTRERFLLTGAGERLGYDALLLALGVSASRWLPGSLTYEGAGANDAFRGLLDGLEAGELGSLVFAVPPTVRWSLPLYELALLSASHLAERGAPVSELGVVSPEARPLEMFGERASGSVSALLAEAGVAFHANAAPSAIEGSDLVVAGGERIPADRVVSLPALEVAAIPGIPQAPHGFIGTDLHQRVEGTDHVFAAGDATWFPVKQGGIAAQQADVAASAIAAMADPDIPRAVFRPVLRGVLLT